MTRAIITSVGELPPPLAASVSMEERELIEKLKKNGLPFAVTPHFASLAKPDADDPIRRQFMPSPLELRDDPFALNDPLGEAQYRLASRLVHQYHDRALLLAGGTCAGFCRYCFRRAWLRAPAGFISAQDLEPVLSSLASRPAIREILVSGGDPLTAGNGELADLFSKIRRARPDICIRLCTRIPVTNPHRLDGETIALLAQFKPLRIAAHINHPQELAPAAQNALASAVEAGIPVFTQTVLLRGINDNAHTLAALFRDCRDLGLSPYYLFQLDLAPGTAHFRVPLKQGISLYRELESLTGEDALPAYAVDLPGGGGKIRLSERVIAGEKDSQCGRAYLLKGADGRLWEYPA
ncbi:MAG: KamA family radical SAM protein [Treponema sp.]|nr:KamA family radical SAM protein [Treponema sp.]